MNESSIIAITDAASDSMGAMATLGAPGSRRRPYAHSGNQARKVQTVVERCSSNNRNNQGLY